MYTRNIRVAIVLLRHCRDKLKSDEIKVKACINYYIQINLMFPSLVSVPPFMDGTVD